MTPSDSRVDIILDPEQVVDHGLERQLMKNGALHIKSSEFKKNDKIIN